MNNTKEWLKKQAIWYDRDMIVLAAIGFLVGLCLGHIFL